MAARKRSSVARSASSESQMTYSRFLELFPDNDACLEYLRGKFFPDGSDCPGCGKTTKYFRIRSRAAYSCMYCRHQAYPTAGTIFHKSTLSLQLWFWAIYLMSSTRCGISAKQLEREIGVTYKTALRMFRQIRTLLADEGDEKLSGRVEIDETYIGGFEKGLRGRPKPGGKKTAVLGMVERGGRVAVSTIPDSRKASIMPIVTERVLPKSMVYTDELKSYGDLQKAGYDHRRIFHHQRVYVMGDISTNTVEGFFGLLKNGIRGVYHSVSKRHLQSYLDEYAWRYNHRTAERPMFWLILDRVQKTPALASR